MKNFLLNFVLLSPLQKTRPPRGWYACNQQSAICTALAGALTQFEAEEKAVPVVAVSRQRNEKEVLMQRREGGRGTHQIRVPNFNLLEAGEVITVDPVPNEHAGAPD